MQWTKGTGETGPEVATMGLKGGVGGCYRTAGARESGLMGFWYVDIMRIHVQESEIYAFDARMGKLYILVYTDIQMALWYTTVTIRPISVARSSIDIEWRISQSHA